MVVRSLIHHHLVAERLSVFACTEKLYAFKLLCLLGSCSVSLHTLNPAVCVWFWSMRYLVRYLVGLLLYFAQTHFD